MSGFEETTRKMADEVAAKARHIASETRRQDRQLNEPAFEELKAQVGDLAAAVEKLAQCVARRLPGRPDETPAHRHESFCALHPDHLGACHDATA
jgi:hypothetical protein